MGLDFFLPIVLTHDFTFTDDHGFHLPPLACCQRHKRAVGTEQQRAFWHPIVSWPLGFAGYSSPAAAPVLHLGKKALSTADLFIRWLYSISWFSGMAFRLMRIGCVPFSIAQFSL